MFSTEGDTYRQALQQEKTPLIAALQARGVTIISQAEHVINSITISATAGDLAWIRTQPGVKSAHFAAVHHVHLNAATQLIGAQQVWNQIGGAAKAGAGIKIAMLDSGIDITHPMFSASGFNAPAGFPKTNTGAGSGYTNAKVIVAKNYICSAATGSCPNDPDRATSWDHNGSDGLGHGTGTASVAAGNCVTNTPFNVQICGVAPGAWLGNYKVFNSVGDGVDESQAINDAVADGMNIINYSGGGDATGLSPTDSSFADEYTAIKNAAMAGVPVIVSAGNCGPAGSSDPSCITVGDNSVNDPAIMPYAIAAGASSNSHVLGNALTLSSAAPGSLQTIATAPVFNASATSQVASYTAPGAGPAVIVDVATINASGTACSALPAGSLTGKIALLKYDFDLPCDSSTPDTTSTNNAKAAGAVGVIYIDPLPEELLGPFNFLAGGSIPSTLITYQTGLALQAYVDANPGKVTGQFAGTPSEPPQTADQVADYSSRGPVNDFSLKPDLTAPGDMLVATPVALPDINNGAIYDPSGYSYNEGTSYSAPMTSGAAAVLMALRPSLNAFDIKSALVNTGSPLSSTQDLAVLSVQMTGGGRVNLPGAINTMISANPVSVSFGQVTSPAAGYSQSQSVTLKELGTSAETYNVAVVQAVTNAGLSITVPSTVSVSPGGTTSLAISLKLSAQVFGIYEGTIVLTSQSSSQTIHIPYWVMLGTPTFPAGSLVDGAGFGKNVSPGDIVSLFGTDLGTQGAGASFIPLPVDVNHTVVGILGNFTGFGNTEFVTPIFYSSSGQVNFMIPYELETGSTATVFVFQQGVQGASSLDFTPNATSPGIFTSNGTAVVTHQSGALVTAANPATAGEVVTIYCAGLGATNPTIFEGDPGPIPPATTTATATVSIGGANASVSFAGLTPLFAGLYQVNATIPSSVHGPQTITISIGGATSNAPTTYVQ